MNWPGLKRLLKSFEKCMPEYAIGGQLNALVDGRTMFIQVLAPVRTDKLSHPREINCFEQAAHGVIGVERKKEFFYLAKFAN